MAAVALPWLILGLTDSATFAGVTASSAFGMVFLGSLAGGFLIDRYGARATAIVAGIMGVLCVALVPMVASLGPEMAWAIVVLSAFGALLDAPGMAAQDNRIPEMATAAGLSLSKALSAKSFANNIMFLCGPAMAGGIIGIWGLGAAFWIAATCTLVSVLLSAAYLPGPEGPRTAGRAGLWAGISFILSDPPMRRMLLLVLIIVGCSGTIMSVQLPALFQSAERSVTDLGFASAALGAGAVTGAVLLSIWGDQIHRRGLLGASVVSAALLLMPVALLPPLPIIMLILLLHGILMSPLGLTLNITLFERTPKDLRGRVQGSAAALTIVAAAPVALISGIAIERAGPVAVLLASLSGVAVCGLIAWFMSVGRVQPKTSA